MKRTLGTIAFWLLLLTGLGAVAVRWFLYDFFEIHSEAMLPDVVPGDTLAVNKRRLPQRGEIAVIESPTRPGMKAILRAVAVPGDTLELRRDATPSELLVNGQVVYRGLGGRRYKKTLDGFFLLADAGRSHEDSRHFGPVSPALVRGTATHILFPSKARAKRDYLVPLRPRTILVSDKSKVAQPD